MTRMIREPALVDACERLRAEVRRFVADRLADYPPEKRAESWNGFSPEFSREVGERGWIGMTWPRAYGGQERSMHERYVIWEELLAAGAPIVTCLPVDRQNGPLLLDYASDAIKRRLLPAMARGEVTFCVGMSEPGSGSDLASVASRAIRVEGGWRLHGHKIWTSYAHEAHYMVGLFRTAVVEGRKHAGLSQFLIDLGSPGITIRPIRNQLGDEHFNECWFEDVFVPDDHLLGREGEGWTQVTRELGYERSGPERYLSSIQLLIEMVNATPPNDERKTTELGKLIAEGIALREMSLGVVDLLERRESPANEAAMVKDRGAAFEQKIPDLAHDVFGVIPDMAGTSLARVMAYTQQTSPQFSIRGGTPEILRGIIARGLGL